MCQAAPLLVPQVQEAQAVTREMRSRLASQPGSQELQAALDTAAALERELASVQQVVAVREEELKGVQEAARQQAEQARAALRESQRKVRGLQRRSLLLLHTAGLHRASAGQRQHRGKGWGG